MIKRLFGLGASSFILDYPFLNYSNTLYFLYPFYLCMLDVRNLDHPSPDEYYYSVLQISHI